MFIMVKLRIYQKPVKQALFIQVAFFARKENARGAWKARRTTQEGGEK